MIRGGACGAPYDVCRGRWCPQFWVFGNMLWACHMYQSRWTLNTCFATHIMDMHHFFMVINVIFLYEMCVINANLEHGLQYYRRSGSGLWVYG